MQIDSYWNGVVAFDGDYGDANPHPQQQQQQQQQQQSPSGILFKNFN